MGSFVPQGGHLLAHAFAARTQCAAQRTHRQTITRYKHARYVRACSHTHARIQGLRTLLRLVGREKVECKTMRGRVGLRQASVREVKRLDSISRSPVYSSLGEALSGLATIRAFHAESRLSHRNGDLVDRSVVMSLVNMSMNRWVPTPPENENVSSRRQRRHCRRLPKLYTSINWVVWRQRPSPVVGTAAFSGETGSVAVKALYNMRSFTPVLFC